MNRNLLIVVLGMVMWSSCYYDVEEDLYNTDCNTETVGFAADIQPLIEQNCITCHSDAAAPSFGGVSLQTHTKVKVYVDNGKFLGSVRHDGGFSPMPQNQAKLSQCNISKIEKWIDEGAQNN